MQEIAVFSVLVSTPSPHGGDEGLSPTWWEASVNISVVTRIGVRVREMSVTEAT